MQQSFPARIVDTHVHAGLKKYEPIESLLDQLFRHRVDHAVLVQHAGEPDNRYLIECAERFPGRFAVVCLVDVRQEVAADQLTAWVAASPAVQGVRVHAADLLDGVPGAMRLWRRADELGLNVSLAGTAQQLARRELACTVDQLRQARFHLEHIGRPDGDEAPPFDTYRRALELARFPNVLIKASGFYACTRRPDAPYLDTLPFFELAFQAFGARRMMWGSDFPPVSAHEGYANALRFVLQHLPLGGPEERAAVLGRTALSVWRFDLLS